MGRALSYHADEAMLAWMGEQTVLEGRSASQVIGDALRLYRTLADEARRAFRVACHEGRERERRPPDGPQQRPAPWSRQPRPEDARLARSSSSYRSECWIGSKPCSCASYGLIPGSRGNAAS